MVVVAETMRSARGKVLALISQLDCANVGVVSRWRRYREKEKITVTGKQIKDAMRYNARGGGGSD